MKQVLIKQGKAFVEEVPAPLVEPGTVLVQVDHSCISIGTEMSGVRSSGEPLWKKALKSPDKVAKVLQMAASQGVARTTQIVQDTLAAGSATGYSAAGTVLAVGDGIDTFKPGDRVACAGAQCAHHAEVINVPRNLTVAIPDGVDFAAASTVTLGAIALQGVRRANPTLGETFVVIGLGILGQLTVQLLKANGCRVIGTDLDSARVELATQMGMDMALNPEGDDAVKQALRLSDGIGVDGVIVTAATPSNEVMSTAFRMCRKKGRVVLVGDVGLDLKRGDFYAKELDFFISTSYGPGRYDRPYEEEGLDYPISYVRWTENRNMGEYLRLVEDGRVSVVPLIGASYQIDDATEAYESLKGEGAKSLMVLLQYPAKTADEVLRHKVANPRAMPAQEGLIRIAVAGAGSFAKAMHMPNLRSLPERFRIHAVMSRTGHNAQSTAQQFGAAYATTDYQAMLDDPDVDAVLITTRHDLHAEMALSALAAGKHVLVEKPLALNAAELDRILAFYEGKAEAPLLLTGFNRRFSPHMQRIRDLVRNRSNPMILNYRMNAGHIPLDHWVHGPEGGGRNIGEACHIYDLFTLLTGAEVVNVHAQAIAPATGHFGRNDNFVATLGFADGSVATLTYTALGASAYPKEQLHVYVDGMVITMDDYTTTTVYGGKGKGLITKGMQKGQREEIIAFGEAIRSGGEWPIPLWQQAQAMRCAFQIEHQFDN